MKLITRNDLQCVRASFEMVMGVEAGEFGERLGHDGMQVIAEDQGVPAKYRSYHPQEFIDVLLDWGYSCTMIELDPCMKHGNLLINHAAFLGQDRFFRSLLKGDGVIFGRIKGSKTGHAVAWNSSESKIYDPRGYTYQWNGDQDFEPRQFFLIQKVEAHG